MIESVIASSFWNIPHTGWCGLASDGSRHAIHTGWPQHWGILHTGWHQQCPLKHVLAYNVALLTYLTITIVLHIRCILYVDHYTEVILLENKTFGLPCIVLRHCTLHHTVSRMRGILEIWLIKIHQINQSFQLFLCMKCTTLKQKLNLHIQFKIILFLAVNKN